MENKENTGNIPSEPVNKLLGFVSKVRRSVLKEFDPLATESPIATPKKPVIYETIEDDEDIFEDAETSLPSNAFGLTTSAKKAIPSRKSYGLLIPELNAPPVMQTFNDTGDLSFMECVENTSQAQAINASDDSVEFNYSVRKSVLVPQVTEHSSIHGTEQLNSDMHEFMFVDTESDKTINGTMEEYDPLGMSVTEIAHSDPLCVDKLNQTSHEILLKESSDQAEACGQEELEAKELNKENMLDQGNLIVRPLVFLNEAVEVPKEEDTILPNPQNELNCSYEQAVESESQICLEAGAKLLNKTLDQVLMDPLNKTLKELNKCELLEQAEEPKGSVTEPQTSLNQTIDTFNKTMEEIPQGSSLEVQNQLFEQPESNKINCDVREAQSFLNQTCELDKANNTETNKTLEQVKGLEMVSELSSLNKTEELTVKVNETFEQQTESCEGEESISEVQTCLNQTSDNRTFDQGNDSKVGFEQISLNRTKENSQELNETLEQQTESCEGEESISEVQTCLNQTVDIGKANDSEPNTLVKMFDQVEGLEVGSKQISLNKTKEIPLILNETFEQQTDSSEAICDAQESIPEAQQCLNQTIDVEKPTNNDSVNETFDQVEGSEVSLKQISLKETKKLPLKLNETFEQQTETSEVSCEAEDLIPEVQPCLNQTIDIGKASNSETNTVDKTFDQVKESEVCAENISLNKIKETPLKLNETFEQQTESPATNCDAKESIPSEVEDDSNGTNPVNKTFNQGSEVASDQISFNENPQKSNETFEQQTGSSESTSGTEESISERRNVADRVEEPESVAEERLENLKIKVRKALPNMQNQLNHIFEQDRLASERRREMALLENQRELDRIMQTIKPENMMAELKMCGQQDKNFGGEPMDVSYGSILINTQFGRPETDEPMDVSYGETGHNESKQMETGCVNKTIEIGQIREDNHEACTIEEPRQPISDRHSVNFALDSPVTSSFVAHEEQDKYKFNNHEENMTEEPRQSDRRSVSFAPDLPVSSSSVKHEEQNRYSFNTHEVNITGTREEPRQSNRRSVNFASDLPTIPSFIANEEQDQHNLNNHEANTSDITEEPRQSMPGDLVSSTFIDDDEQAERAVQVLAQSMNKTIDAEESAIVEEICSTDDSGDLDATFDAKKDVKPENPDAAKEVPSLKPLKVECRPNIRALRNKTQVIESSVVLKAAQIGPKDDDAQAKVLEELKSVKEKLIEEKARLQQELDELEKDNRKKDQYILEHALREEAWKDSFEKYRRVLKEYEKHLQKQAQDLENQKRSSEELVRDFVNTEMAFSAATQKYEKAKTIVGAYQKNEEVMKQNLKNAELALVKLQMKCEALKKENKKITEEMEKSLEKEKRDLKTTLTKLQNEYKKLEIEAQSLETALSAKTKECDALSALCDAITAGQT
ncbi:putative leucine-rich repeat-containing protein DDB_G0290503 [Anthonomus grandis grandis]|uniref:putative leucine-rich repeat-containing protein DDB_G0290503 n=1 Tax=Anthonomus grandis grandis TaxID=2921223 RepID=UPI002165A7A3|nr:putative leucine-rich repeat-containing protein DDB_G0290503 [Anthonomus grandis grandis]